jgi:outer membrane biogenesis lipoprotein LolB
MRITAFTLCVASVLLTACATAPLPSAQPNSGTAAAAHTTRIGRISVQAPDARGALQNWHAGFEFVEAGATRTLRLTDPLGTTLANIQADAAGARLTAVNGEQTAYGSLTELTERVTGVALPDAAWRYWLDGVPAPQLPVQQRAQLGFGQSGFWINVLNRFENNQPRVLEITRPDSPELRVRVALEAAP